MPANFGKTSSTHSGEVKGKQSKPDARVPRPPRASGFRITTTPCLWPTLLRLVCLDLACRHLGRIGHQRGQMLRHELPGPEGRLLLGLLVLEDAPTHDGVTARVSDRGYRTRWREA